MRSLPQLQLRDRDQEAEAT